MSYNRYIVKQYLYNIYKIAAISACSTKQWRARTQTLSSCVYVLGCDEKKDRFIFMISCRSMSFVIVAVVQCTVHTHTHTRALYMYITYARGDKERKPNHTNDEDEKKRITPVTHQLTLTHTHAGHIRKFQPANARQSWFSWNFHWHGRIKGAICIDYSVC